MQKPIVVRVFLMCTLLMGMLGTELSEGQVAQSADRINSDIDVLLKAEDYGPQERQLFRDLPVEAVPIFIARIKEAGNSNTAMSLSSLLSTKLVQLGKLVPVPERRAAIDLMLAECAGVSGVELSIRLNVLKPLVDPEIDAFITSLATGGDESKRQAATLFLKERERERKRGAISMVTEAPGR
jgi:hypothetical protein